MGDWFERAYARPHPHAHTHTHTCHTLHTPRDTLAVLDGSQRIRRGMLHWVDVQCAVNSGERLSPSHAGRLGYCAWLLAARTIRAHPPCAPTH